MKNKKLIILVCGGTGGHVYPAIALKESLKKGNYRYLFFTDNRCKKIFKDYKLDYQVIYSGNFSRNYIAIPFNLVKIITGFFQTLKLFFINRPSLVIGFGGYTSVPSIIAAKMAGITTIIHEQNAVMGKANIFLSTITDYVALTYKETIGLKTKKKIHTGIPIRQVFFSQEKKRKKKQSLTLLVIGGSQGAKIFSNIIPEILNSVKPDLLNKISLIQQAKIEDINKLNSFYKKLKINYLVKPFFKNIHEEINNADIVISRSGASSLAEIEACSKLSLLFPLPTSTKNHQYENAIQFKRNNKCFIFDEKNLNIKKIVKIIEQCIIDPKIYNLRRKTFGSFKIKFEILIKKCIENS